jgi:uncharacterized protein (DUF58 family)
MSLRGLTFRLVPRRRRLIGLAFGAMHGVRRGTGTDVAGSRAYRPGDNPDRIDWAASARLSAARATDEFIVREHFADEAPRVVVVADRRPEMALCPPELPWLRKDVALRVAVDLIVDSVADARGLVGYLDFAEGAETPFWRAPQSHSEVWSIRERQVAYPTFGAPEDNVELALEFLATHRRAVPSGCFVFVLSDFIVSPGRDVWERALDRGWDIVPAVIQDPIWEQSFPQLDEIVAPLADAHGRRRLVRLRGGESDELRREHERRRDGLLAGFRSLGMQPILVSTSDPDGMLDEFVAWSSEREFERGLGL